MFGNETSKLAFTVWEAVKLCKKCPSKNVLMGV